AEQEIVRPVFIIGFPRSGTTLLHSLLAEDPDVLKLQSWHIYSPSPPPGAGPVVAERIGYAQREVEAWMNFCPAQKPMHPYVDKGAFQLIEDEELFTLDFRNAYPYHFYRVPTLDVMATLGGDQIGALRFHREVLQHLQWNTGKDRWVCKSPSAQMHLDALFAVYPDALCVWPHRPLGEIYASNVALRAAVYDAIRGRPNDWSSQAPRQAEAMKAAVDRLIASELIEDPRILHLRFDEIAADPLAAVRKVYDYRGIDMSAEAEARVTAWLTDPENASDRYGRYPYSYEAFGLDRAWIEDLFADYSRRFGLAGG
ncbi:MAG: sulfotransferase, partial [Novosphingobium sp.]|nr:sulfotransferase [Novosphingobium sp.]